MLREELKAIFMISIILFIGVYIWRYKKLYTTILDYEVKVQNVLNYNRKDSKKVNFRLFILEVLYKYSRIFDIYNYKF